MPASHMVSALERLRNAFGTPAGETGCVEARQQYESTVRAGAAGAERALRRPMVVGWNVDFTVGRERTHRFRPASSVRAPAKTGHIPIDTAAVRDHVSALVLPGGNTLLHKVASTTGDESAWPAGCRRLTRPRALWVVGRVQSLFEAYNADVEGKAGAQRPKQRFLKTYRVTPPAAAIRHRRHPFRNNTTHHVDCATGSSAVRTRFRSRTRAPMDPTRRTQRCAPPLTFSNAVPTRAVVRP